MIKMFRNIVFVLLYLFFFHDLIILITPLDLEKLSWVFGLQQARIALERRKFLKNAEMAVQRQAMWSNLAHEMTAEFRGLCAEEVR